MPGLTSTRNIRSTSSAEYVLSSFIHNVSNPSASITGHYAMQRRGALVAEADFTDLRSGDPRLCLHTSEPPTHEPVISQDTHDAAWLIAGPA